MKWIILILLCSTSIASANHELEDRNLSAGQILYTNNCASCHGAKLEGQPNWQSPNSDGILPAPPHDATGHTWHHDNELLFEYTKLGGKGALAARGITDFNSGMPAFDGVISDEDIWDILAFIKSTWPEREQDAQASRNLPH
ncbi:MAG: cytochrome c [Rhodobacterales bacterium]|jgi:mono/diheme cytochrome c family protein|nr:cytochrome c [Rhodobacterales bacterium]MDA7739573.1 cytochrome c [Amylibacter sp.]MBT6008881.1 cytochrome c [Rhodobacterales bacterium]MBT6832598.1 cytochrome c [Rhodobacterales bacterium]MDB2338533.1 cytochrome c [Amylibacter sp.]|tara:strand:- start:547 stop:972 length:426 start_codon:yes stop_codon:yes gene_type:complete